MSAFETDIFSLLVYWTSTIVDADRVFCDRVPVPLARTKEDGVVVVAWQTRLTVSVAHCNLGPGLKRN